MLRISVGVMWILLLIGSANGAERQISGVLVHAGTGEPLPGKTLAYSLPPEPWPSQSWKPLHVRNAETWTEVVTGPDGTFHFSTHQNGRYILLLRDSVYALPRGYAAEVIADGDASREVRLVACEGAVVEVMVVGADGKTPVQGNAEGLFLSSQMQVLQGMPPVARPLVYGKASDSGSVVLGPMPPGEYTPFSAPDDGIRFAIPERRTQMELLDIPLQWGENRTVTLRVARLPILERRVALPTGAPGAGASVRVDAGEEWAFDTYSDAEGIVRFEDVEDLMQGTVGLRKDNFATVISGADYLAANMPIVLSPSATPVTEVPTVPQEIEATPVVVHKGSSHRLRGRVVDSSGAPLFGAWIQAGSLGDNLLESSSNESGTFGIPIEEAGAVVAKVSHEAYGQRDFVLPNVMTPQQFELPKRARLKVQVTLAGEAATGSFVALLPAVAGLQSPMPESMLPGMFTFPMAVHGDALLTAALEVEGNCQRRRQAWLSLEAGKDNSTEVAFPKGSASLTISAGVGAGLDELGKAIVHVDLLDGSQEMVSYSSEETRLPITIEGLPVGNATVYILGEVKGYWNETVALRADETALLELKTMPLAQMKGELEGMREGFEYEAYLLHGKPNMERMGSVLRVHHGSPGELVLWADTISKQGAFELQAVPGQEVTLGIAEKRAPQNLAQSKGGWRWVHVETITPQAEQPINIKAQINL